MIKIKRQICKLLTLYNQEIDFLVSSTQLGIPYFYVKMAIRVKQVIQMSEAGDIYYGVTGTRARWKPFLNLHYDNKEHCESP